MAITRMLQPYGKSFFTLLSMSLLSLFISSPATGSVGIYVGSELTEDGSVLLGGYGDEPSSHWIELIRAGRYEREAMICVGADENARYPGIRFQIPQAPRTHRYLTIRYSGFAGFPPPQENGGLNEYNVAARDIWSPSRSELLEMTPDPQFGLTYSDLSRIAMERATTAREAAEIVGELVDRHGYATYGGNSHLFADSSEGWVLIQFAGGQGLWVAERLGSDEIRVSRPGTIGEIPDNYLDHPDYMGSENLISFAIEQGWYDPQQDGSFNVNKVYGTDRQPSRDGFHMKAAEEEAMEEWLRQRGKITLEDMKAAVRSPIITSQTAGYGTVVQLRDDTPRDLRTLWITVAPAISGPFVPYYIGMDEIPMEFTWGRYLSIGESRQFLPAELQPREAMRYAFQVFMRLFHALDGPRTAPGVEWFRKEYFSDRFNTFYPEVRQVYEAFEAEMRAEQQWVREGVILFLEQDREDLSGAFLTEYSNRRSLRALDLAEALTMSIEARSRLLFDMEVPTSIEIYRDR